MIRVLEIFVLKKAYKIIIQKETLDFYYSLRYYNHEFTTSIRF